MSLLEITMSAIMLLASQNNIDTVAEKARLETLGRGITAAAQSHQLAFRGPAEEEAAALALVAIAQHESGLRADVQDCRRRGDLEISSIGAITSFQLLGKHARGKYSVEALCASPELAAKRAMKILSDAGERCKFSPHVAIFYGYASGSCGRTVPAGLRQCMIWERLAKKAGLKGAYCATRSEITK